MVRELRATRRGVPINSLVEITVIKGRFDAARHSRAQLGLLGTTQVWSYGTSHNSQSPSFAEDAAPPSEFADGKVGSANNWRSWFRLASLTWIRFSVCQAGLQES